MLMVELHPSARCAAVAAAAVLLVILSKRRILRRVFSEESRPEARHLTDLTGELEEHDAAACLSEPLPGREGFIARGFIAPSECAALIAAAERMGFGVAAYDREYRGNLRLMTEDPNLSAALWHRLSPHLPPEVVFTLDGARWRADSLCSTWKWSKYVPKAGRDAFAPHVDGTHWPEPQLRSFFSLNIYLNDDFVDGCTRFYTSTTSDVVDYVCKPEVGMALVFRQPPTARYLHDGQPVREGTKYLWRCDVMYRKLP